MPVRGGMLLTPWESEAIAELARLRAERDKLYQERQELDRLIMQMRAERDALLKRIADLSAQLAAIQKAEQP